MTKTELVAKIAEGAGITKATAEKALNSFIAAVGNALATDEKITWWDSAPSRSPRDPNEKAAIRGRARPSRFLPPRWSSSNRAASFGNW